jgi:CHAT domain-containing protein/tetratricopeptide (TPR) repeat protein
MRSVVARRIALLACVAALSLARPGTEVVDFAHRATALEDLLLAGRYDEAEEAARARFQTIVRTNGADSLAAADASELLVRVAIRNGKSGSSEILGIAERTLVIKERHLGGAHPDLVAILGHLGESLSEVPDAMRAIAMARRAVKIAEQSKRLSPSDLVHALDTLGLVLSKGGGHDEAIAVLERSLQIRAGVGSSFHRSETRTLELLATTLQTKGEYAAARPFAERALAAHQANDADGSSVAALNVYARQLWFEGRAPEARHWSEKALGIAETRLRPQHPAIVDALINLAAALVIAGDLQPARALQQRALDIAEREWAPDHYRTAACLNDLANSDLLLGNYSEARYEFERALNIAQKRFGRVHEWVATHVHNLALVDAHLGDFVSAMRQHAEAVAIWEEVRGVDHPFVAVALTELAGAMRAHGNVAQAVPLLDRALRIRERSLGPEHRDVAQTLADLAATLSQLGQTDHAQELALRALAVWERTDAPDAPDFATALALYADLQAARGDPATARRYFERALAIRAKTFGPTHPAFADTQIRLAIVLATLGNAASAIQIARAGEDTGREHLRLMVRSLPERESLNYAVSRPRALDLILSLVRTVPDAATSALDAVIRSRALVLDEMVSRIQSVSATSADVADLRTQLLSARQRFANLVVRGPQGQAIEGYSALIDEAKTAKEAAERALAERSARFRAELSFERAGLDDIRRAMPAGSALLSFVRYRHTTFAAPPARSAPSSAEVPSYLAFVVRPDREPIVVPLGSASAIDLLVAQWRSHVSADSLRRAPGDASAAARASGIQLRRAIWDELAGHIGDATTVFVVPDDALSLVPLVALPGKKSEFVLEEAPVIHYLTAERDLVQAGAREPEPSQGLLAVGGPAFDDESNFTTNGIDETAGPVAPHTRPLRSTQSQCDSFQTMQFRPLAGTLQEVQDVAQLWRGISAARAARVLVSNEATERLFKQEAPRHQVIHLATHGFFLGASCPSTTEGLRAVGGLVSGSGSRTREVPQAVTDSPLLLSGVALAGANRRASAGGGDEDGILTAEEVSGLDLSGVRWAVLSACNTGVGEVRASEGVFGLRRAFQIAGARTVIMSLWSVEDDATRLWMRELYDGRLTKGLNTADAVREASVTLLRTRRAAGQSTHPFYWAAFVAAGDWR